MEKDNRAEKLAELVLNYSVNLQRGDRLVVQADPAYTDYANLIIQKAKKIGATVRYDSLSLSSRYLKGLLEQHDIEEWKEDLARRIELAKWCNSRILIDCNSNPGYANGIPDSQKKIAEYHKEVIGPYKKVLYRPGSYSAYAVKWNITGFPSEEEAKVIGMSFKDYSDFVYSSTLGNNWRQMNQQMKKIKQTFDNSKDIHILVPELTDIHLSLEGRGGEICDGKFNMPDGEVCYGPIENSANGFIYFSCPTKRDGLGIVEGVSLEMQAGVVNNYSAKTNVRLLEETLKIDNGVKMLGEFGIGCNYSVKKPVLEVLFDEKIGGTIHLALGHSLNSDLKNGGGLNDSAIHWDLICDLRKDESNLSEFPGGKIFVDGKLVQENGLWKI